MAPKKKLTSAEKRLKEHLEALEDRYKNELIGEVRNRPYLYDKSHPQYKNAQFVDKQWLLLAKSLNPPRSKDECKSTWVKLKNAFRLERNIQEKLSGSAMEARKPVPFWHDLQFLQRHVARRNRSKSTVGPVQDSETEESEADVPGAMNADADVLALDTQDDFDPSQDAQHDFGISEDTQDDFNPSQDLFAGLDPHNSSQSDGEETEVDFQVENPLIRGIFAESAKRKLDVEFEGTPARQLNSTKSPRLDAVRVGVRTSPRRATKQASASPTINVATKKSTSKTPVKTVAPPRPSTSTAPRKDQSSIHSPRSHSSTASQWSSASTAHPGSSSVKRAPAEQTLNETVSHSRPPATSTTPKRHSLTPHLPILSPQKAYNDQKAAKNAKAKHEQDISKGMLAATEAVLDLARRRSSSVSEDTVEDALGRALASKIKKVLSTRKRQFYRAKLTDLINEVELHLEEQVESQQTQQS